MNTVLRNLNTVLSKKKKITVWSRNSKVLPEFIGLRFNVYQGKRFISLVITEAMVGHKIGEFAPTRQRHVFKKKRLKGK